MADDSSFSRLTQAWNHPDEPDVMSAARRGLDLLARTVGLPRRLDSSRVLWLGLSLPNQPSTAVISLAMRRRNFQLEHLIAGPEVDVDQLLHDRRPRLLVADVDWCAQVGIATVRRLHRHQPEIDWLLCWDEPSPRWLETLVQSGARGTVLRNADDTALARAFDAVVTGELWLPRQVLQWLYATLIEAPGSDHLTSLPPAQWAADSELTHRESEVAALMRQGLTNRDIADRLGVSINTVKKHLASAYEKQGIRSRRQMRL